MSLEVIKRQAKYLAQENRLAEPDIVEVYWFPNDIEVRLVELSSSIPASGDGRVHPFYFRSDPHEHLPAPSGIALIRPEEFRRLETPKDWGGWDKAIRVEPEEEK
jgi:hypothetical protein